MGEIGINYGAISVDTNISIENRVSRATSSHTNYGSL